MACGCAQSAQNQNYQQNQQIVQQKSIDNKNMTLDELLEQYQRGNNVILQSMHSIQQYQPEPTQQQQLMPVQTLQNPQMQTMATDDSSVLVAFIIGVVASLTAIFIAKKWIKF